jgi:TolB-like protein
MNRAHLIGLVLLIMLGGYVAATFKRNAGPIEAPAEAISIVIMPFVDLAQRAEFSKAAAQLTAKIAKGLRETDRFQVESAESALVVELERADSHQIARDLGAEYAVEGAVRDAGERIWLSAQLVTAEPETHIWAASYEIPLEELDVVAQQVVWAVAVAVEDSSNNSLQRTGQSVTSLASARDAPLSPAAELKR